MKHMHDMKQKLKFVKPAVLQELTLLPDSPFLQASVVDVTTVTTTGQEVETYDWSNDTFNHDWNAE